MHLRGDQRAWGEEGRGRRLMEKKEKRREGEAHIREGEGKGEKGREGGGDVDTL